MAMYLQQTGFWLHWKTIIISTFDTAKWKTTVSKQI